MSSYYKEQVITDQEFDKMFEDELTMLRTRYSTAQDEYAPTLRVALRGGFDEELTYDYVVFEDFGKDRFEMMRTLGMKYWRERQDNGIPVALMFTAEAWMKKLEGDGAKAEWEKAGKAVSDYPDKEECLATFGATLTGDNAFASHAVNRNKKGQINGLKLNLYIPVTANQEAQESPLLNSFYQGVGEAMNKEKRND